MSKTKARIEIIKNEFSCYRIKPIEFRHDQELHSNLEDIIQGINSITIDQKQREYALVKFGGILLGNKSNHKFVVKRFNYIISACIIKQITDFQTSIVTLGCGIIRIAIKELGLKIESGLEKMLTSSALFLLVPSVNTIISDTSANTIYQIVRYIQTTKIIVKICLQSESKYSKVKYSCAQALQYIIFHYTISTIMENQQIIENALKLLLSDIMPNVNEIARETYYIYLFKYEAQAKVLYNLLDKNVKKAVDNPELRKTCRISKIHDTVTLSQSYKIKNNSESSGVLSGLVSINFLDPHSSNNAFDNRSNNDGDNDHEDNEDMNKKRNEYLEDVPKVSQNKKDILKHINKRLEELELVTSGSSALFQTKIENTERFIRDQINLIKTSKSIPDKQKVFEAIDKKFNEIFSLFKVLNHSLLDQLIDVHIENMLETNKNLLKQILKNLSSLIFYMNSIFNEKSINYIVKLTITHFSSGNPVVIKSCKQLMSIIEKKLDSNAVMKAFLELLSYEDCDEETCYQSMVSIIDYSRNTLEDAFFFASLFVKLCRSLPESPSLIKIIDKLYRNHQSMFINTFEISSYDDKKLLKYILEFHNSYLLKHLSFNFITIGKVIQYHNDSNKHNDINNNAISPEDMLCDEMVTFIKENDMESFIYYALNKDNEQIRKFLINLIMFPKEDLGVILIFLFGLINQDHSTVIINENIRLVVDSLIYILINNHEQIDKVKEILVLLPFQIQAHNYFSIVAKFISTGNDEFIVSLLMMTISNYIKVNKEKGLLELLPSFFHSLVNMLNHPLADIRKDAVHLLVDIYLLLGVKFDSFMKEIPKPNQNLLDIFIKKRQGINY